MTEPRPGRTVWSASEAGQASLELLAAIPALVLAALVALQLLVVGYAVTLADGAAEAGALALAAGYPPRPAVADALPGWADDQVSIAVDRGNVRVTVEPPSAVPALARKLAVTSSAWAQLPEEDG